MVRDLALDDFRAVRKILEPDDFLLSDGRADPPPTDLIDEDTWHHIMTLPGDVAITTTGYQGSRVSLMCDLNSEWISAIPRTGITGHAMYAIWNNLEACIFNTVHGYYKTALATLRMALETSVIGARCALAQDHKRWAHWSDGAEFRFGGACNEAFQLPVAKAREVIAISLTGVGIFSGGQRKNGDAWARSLYGRLCAYSHARGDTTDSQIWQSNGPVYSARGMKLCYDTFLETYAIMLLLAKWGNGRLALMHNGKLILRKSSLKLYLSEPYQALASHYRHDLWRR